MFAHLILGLTCSMEAGKEGTHEFVRCLNHFEKAFMDDEHWL